MLTFSRTDPEEKCSSERISEEIYHVGKNRKKKEERERRHYLLNILKYKNLHLGRVADRNVHR
jgi:hypothetical protein